MNKTAEEIRAYYAGKERQRVEGEIQNARMREFRALVAQGWTRDNAREHLDAKAAGTVCVCDACWEGSDGQKVAREYA